MQGLKSVYSRHSTRAKHNRKNTTILSLLILHRIYYENFTSVRSAWPVLAPLKWDEDALLLNGIPCLENSAQLLDCSSEQNLPCSLSTPCCCRIWGNLVLVQLLKEKGNLLFTSPKQWSNSRRQT